MSLTVQQTEALYSLYPSIKTTNGTVAYDENGAEVAYDINSVNAKVAENEQSSQSVKTSAQAKLAALGLTADEIAHLIGA